MAGGVDLTALEKATARIQDAVVDPGAWGSLLDEICVAAGADVATLMYASSPMAEVSVAAITQEAAPFLKHYVDGGWNRADLRTRSIPKLLKIGIAVDQDFTTTGEMQRHPYYQELLRPFGLSWWAGLGFSVGADVWCLALHRRTESGYFDPDEQAKLVPLAASLAQGATISRAIGNARITAMSDALDLVAQPAIVLGHGGQVLRENAAAERLYDAWLYVAGRRVIVRDRQAAAVFATLADECRLLCGLGSRSRQIVVRRGERRPVVVTAHVLSGAAVEPFAGGRMLLLLNDLEARRAAKDTILSAVFGLTPAEAGLAAIIGSGASLEQACEVLKIAQNTGRTQLKRIFQKTEVSRQGELVALLARLDASRPR